VCSITGLKPRYTCVQESVIQLCGASARVTGRSVPMVRGTLCFGLLARLEMASGELVPYCGVLQRVMIPGLD